MMDDPRLTELQALLETERDGRLGYRHLYVDRDELPLLSEELHDRLFRLSHADVQTLAEGHRVYRVPLTQYPDLVKLVNAEVLRGLGVVERE